MNPLRCRRADDAWNRPVIVEKVRVFLQRPQTSPGSGFVLTKRSGGCLDRPVQPCLGQLLQLIDVGDNAPELLGPQRKLGLGNRNAGQSGNLSDDVRADRGGGGNHPDNCKAS